MAPEQVVGDGVGPRTDVWGIGVVLYEAATGGPPRTGEVNVNLNGGGASTVIRSVREARRLPKDLSEAIDACLRREPGARPELMELSARLDSVAEGGIAGDEQGEPLVQAERGR
jgi:serine/threonine protein kinase